jgi:hypothetical protein
LVSCVRTVLVLKGRSWWVRDETLGIKFVDGRLGRAVGKEKMLQTSSILPPGGAAYPRNPPGCCPRSATCGSGDARRTSHRVANSLCSLLSRGAGMESYLGTFFTVKGQHRGGNSELAYASFLSNPSSRTDVLKQARALTLNLNHRHPKPRVYVLPVHTSRKDVLKMTRQVTFVPRALLPPFVPPPPACWCARECTFSLALSLSFSLAR